ncbi:mei2-like protein [Fusarium pseudocircinatum]|uniref:Mei2-like protein n=1 Tax=Fusarium pseudocircinatum TaxID=56676 RepID=A0A8H5PUG5_9HYPO|nr:mei2-like protein [Fusarium pseudocircinatum]
MDKIKFKVRKLFAKVKVRRLLAKDAKAADVTHEERLGQVQRVEGTEHRIERSMDVMVAARRSVYGAHMLPQTTEFGVSAEEARQLHQKQKAEDTAKAAAAQDDGGIWDGTQTSNKI